MATETDIYNGTSVNLPVMLVATKPGIYDEKSGHIQAVLVATKPDIFKEMSEDFSTMRQQKNVYL